MGRVLRHSVCLKQRSLWTENFVNPSEDLVTSLPGVGLVKRLFLLSYELIVPVQHFDDLVSAS